MQITIIDLKKIAEDKTNILLDGFNYSHGYFQNDEAKSKYQTLKKFYGFMPTKKDNGKLTGNKVCTFFLYSWDNMYRDIMLVSQDCFNAEFINYFGHTVYDLIETYGGYGEYSKYLSHFKLFDDKEEAKKALKETLAKLNEENKPTRIAYLEEQIRIKQKELNDLANELNKLKYKD